METKDNNFGLFQRFRPLGRGVEQVFVGVPKGAEFVKRLLSVYASTSHAAWAEDMYFVVRAPIGSTVTEIKELGSRLLTEMRALAAVIGNGELDGYLRTVNAVEV